jgi:hypothetical protein
MHAHISLKQANKCKIEMKKQIKVRLKSNLWSFIFMFMSLEFFLACIKDEAEMPQLPTTNHLHAITN